MNIKLLLQVSFKCIKKHKGRSFLTILGIIAGISAIISTLAIGYGAEEKIKKQILSMGNNFIFIHSGKHDTGKTKHTRRKQPKPLTERDVDIIKEQCPGIKKITPTMFGREIISFRGSNVLAEVKYGNEDYLSIIGRKIKRGSFYTREHLKKKAKVVVIGSKTAKELFHSLNPIGRTVQIKNIHFTVIGEVKPIENYFGFQDPNLDMYIPLSTAKRYFYPRENLKVHGIAISAENKKNMSTITRRLKKILRFKHHLEADDPDDFTIYDQQAMVDAAKTSSNTLNLLLLIIASISLIVGGIGVMNIMLVSVTERTKEIGIRMALGATEKVILKQFIFEAITLCLVGGIIGIILGIIIPHVVSLFTQWIVVIKISTIFFAFFITFIIGLIFGYYPARKASRLNIVSALQET